LEPGQRLQGAVGQPGVKRRAFASGYAVGPEAYARYDPFRIMVDMRRGGLWQAQEEDALGGVEVQERRGSIDLKKERSGRLEVEDPKVPEEPKDGRGGSKP